MSREITVQKIRRLAIEAADRQGLHECAIGWLRYEALRKLNPREIQQLEMCSRRTDMRFDDLVDLLVAGEGLPKWPPFAIGDQVSTERYDETSPPGKRLGGGIVEKVEEGRCESGILVTIKAASGGTVTLDSNWLK